MGVIVKHLPLLDRALVHLDLLLLDLFTSNDVFDPVFEFNKDLFRLRIVLKPREASWVVVNEDLVIIRLQVAGVWRNVLDVELHDLRRLLHQVPKLFNRLFAARVSWLAGRACAPVRLLLHQRDLMVRVLRVQLGQTRQPLFGIFVPAEALFDWPDVEATVSKWQLPVLLK